MNNGEPELITREGLAISTREYLDAELTPETTYYYWVAAYHQPESGTTVWGDFAGPFEVITDDLITGLGDLVKHFELLRLYPNPAQDRLQFELKNEEYDKVQLRVVNALGQVQLNHTFTKKQFLIEETIDITAWKSGMYFVEITQGQFRSVQRIAKQ